MAKSKWKYLFFVAALATSVATFHTVQATITGTTTQTTSSVGNGVTVNYTIGFTFQRNSYLEVYLQDESTTPYTRTLLVYGSGAGKYTITGGDPGTTVVMGTAPSSSQRVVIKRVTPKTQTVDYQQNAAFPAEDHEKAMDKMVMAIQEFSTDISKKVGLSAASSATVPTFPDPVANKILGYNSAGNDLTLLPSSTPSTGDVLRFNGTTWATYDIDTAIGGGGLPTLGNADEVLKVKSDGSDVEYGKVANANIDSAAAIAHSKLANITSGSVLMGNGSNVPTATALSGDVTVDSSGVTAIGAGKVTNGMLAGSIARSKVASGTANQVIVNDVSGNLSGVSGGSNGDVLTFNGTAWTSAAPAGASAALTDSHILVGNASNVATDVAMSGDATIANTGAVTIANSAITDAKVHASAAIAYSKLALTGSIVNADISGSAAIAYSKLNLSGSVVNADLANMASNTIKGNNTGGAAAPSDLTGSQVTALLSNMVGDSGSGGTKGLVPAPAAGDAAAAKFLKADGTWAAPAGSGTVTSVQVAGANGLSFSGGPITGSGTITATLTAPKVTTYTSGSGTWSRTGSPLYIRVRMVGGGGGGTGSGTGSYSAAGAGGNTTFGTTLLVANGGLGGPYGFTSSGTGGTASLGTGPVGTAIQGATGAGGALAQTSGTSMQGASGAVSPFGGAGVGGGSGAAGGDAIANSGSGGGGGGLSGGIGTTNVIGGGGGAGGYVDAIITSPSSTYSYAVGAAGSAGSAGTSGSAGGAGGSGYIEVTEYYQ